MTAHALIGDRQRCLDAWMHDYVSKPIRKSELFHSLNRLRGSAATPDPGTSPGGPLPAVIDWEEASRILGDDEEFHRSLLRSAIVEMRDLQPKLEEALRDSDEKTAHRLAHTIKGAARAVSGEMSA